MLQSIESLTSRRLANWLDGIGSELHFWEQWFATGGSKWPDDFQRRQNPDRQIDPSLLRDVAVPAQCRILDVGAGPMTVLGSVFEGQRLDIVACDPLAVFYADIARRHSVFRPVETETAFAEELSAFYPVNHFDLVHCQNALDHSFEPVRGIEEMLLVAKPGGRIILAHAINEAENESYEGLHQWNFDSELDHFIIWNKDARFDVTEMFAHCADTFVDVHTSSGTITVVMQKRVETPVDLSSRSRDRLRELLPAITVSFHDFAQKAGLRDEHDAAQAKEHVAFLETQIAELRRISKMDKQRMHVAIEELRRVSDGNPQRMHAAMEQLQAIQRSRTYRATQLYVRVYALPIVGPMLRRLRRTAGAFVPAIVAPRGGRS